MHERVELVQRLSQECSFFKHMVAEKSNEEQWTPLLWATHRQNMDLVSLLIDHGAKTTEAKSDGITPIHMAASSNDV